MTEKHPGIKKKYGYLITPNEEQQHAEKHPGIKKKYGYSMIFSEKSYYNR